MNVIDRNEKIPVAYVCDVCVVGGGPAGIGAAFQAARDGKSVILIEQMNCLGGIATAGWHGHICCYCSWDHHVERVVGGTCFELAERLVGERYGTYDGFALDFEVERMKFVLENMVKENGNITLLYYTQFSDVVLHDGKVTHIIIQNKDGRQAIEAGMTVDATADV